MRRNPGRKILSMVLTAAMIISFSSASVFAEEDQTGGSTGITQYVTDIFTDVPASEWYAVPIQKAYTLGLMNGTSIMSFSPEDVMTRAMFVQVLYNISGRPYMVDPTSPFVDLDSDAWYYPAVCWAYENHYISGISANEFGPEELITREQSAKILYSYAGVVEMTGTLNGFEDMDVIDDWAVDSITWAVSSGIIKGSDEYGVLYLFPLNGLTRCEAATLLSSYYEVMNHTKLEVNLPEETHISAAQVKSGVKIPSLMYHEVSDDVWGLSYLFISPSEIRSQFSWLLKNGYEPIFYSDLTHLSDYRKPVLITFDDGYQGNYDNLFPILKEMNIKATIFVVTDLIGTMYHMGTAELKEMSDSGLVSIQSHTHSHRQLDQLSNDEVVKEYQQSKTVISSITGKSPFAISYPEGRSTANSRLIASRFFSFGVQDRNGPWKTSSDLFQAKRVTIGRGLTLTQFAAVVRY